MSNATQGEGRPRVLRRSTVVGLLVALVAGSLTGAPPALAAQLAGGARQTAIDTAFFADGAHRGQTIVSTRISTAAPAWSLVTSVFPQTAATAGTSTRPPVLQRSYFHRLRSGTEQAATPTAVARDDLSAPFVVDVTYSGHGAESIAYDGTYQGVCQGLGGFIDTEQVSVSPMSWTVRYAIDPDDLRSATHGPGGVVLVPRITFVRPGSKLSARETLSRSVIDHSCAGQETRYRCAETWSLAPGTDLLSPTAAGLEVGVPMRPKGTGDCSPDDYALGPSLWDQGATTAFLAQLHVVGGTLPADPYAPIAVTWPDGSLQTADGYVTSPCAADPTACGDAFDWTGTVTLSTPSSG